MAPIFDRKEVLASPYPPVGPVGALLLEFAILGEIELAKDLCSILNREYPMNGLDNTSLVQLHLAWKALGQFPEGSDRLDGEELEGFLEDIEDGLWPEEVSSEKRTVDEAGLKAVLELVELAEGCVEEAEEDDDEEEPEADAAASSALVKALDLSIKIAEKKAGKAPLDKLDAQSEGLLDRIAERLHRSNQSEALAGCASAWPYLARGALAEAAGTNKEKLQKLGKELKETVEEWFSRGPQAWKSSSKSLKELFQTCSDRSKEFWADEYDEPAPDSLFASAGANETDIEALEKKLDTKLPSDYKEFLGISNGFKQIIADGIFEDFEAPLYSTSEVMWRNTKELIKDLDGGEDDDEDEDEMDAEAEPKEEGTARPAKKIKLADGAEASTKDIGDDEDDEEDLGLAWLKGAMGSLNMDLLTLGPSVQLEIIEEYGDEWPEIEKVVEIGSSDDSYLWLLAPEEAKKARDAYIKVLDGTEDESVKKALRWAMIAFVGSEEAFRTFDDWVLVAWSGSQMHAWSSFRRYAEELEDTCLKLEKVDDQEKVLEEETLAYSCR